MLVVPQIAQKDPDRTLNLCMTRYFGEKVGKTYKGAKKFVC